MLSILFHEVPCTFISNSFRIKHLSTGLLIKVLKMLVAQLYLTLCGLMDCSPPGSTVHGILQERILEWVANSFSRADDSSILKQIFSLGHFPHSSVGKESARNAGDLGSIPGSGRSPGEGNGNPLQYSCLENPMDRGAIALGS